VNGDVPPALADVGTAAPRSAPGWLEDLRRDGQLRTAAGLWLCSKVGLLVLSYAVTFIFPVNGKQASWRGLWERWDSSIFHAIAEYGYYGGPPGQPVGRVAFFPGLPLVLRVVHAVVGSWTASELLIGSVASFFAVLGMVRLADDYRPGTGFGAGLFFLLAPAAIFLSVGYSEASFLAFALPAWRAARHGRYRRAGVLAALACLFRANGLFLTAGLVVLAMFAEQGRRRVRLPSAWLALPLISIVGYAWYLKATDGSWLAWFHAESSGWGRSLRNPVTTFTNTWGAAFGHTQGPEVSFMFQIELAAAAALLVTTIVELARRRWGEGVYCLLTLAAMATGFWYESVPRTLLLIWPLWCGLARLAARSRLATGIIVSVLAPLMCVTAMMYLSSQWAA
jgi:hypothetical protein